MRHTPVSLAFSRQPNIRIVPLSEIAIASSPVQLTSDAPFSFVAEIQPAPLFGTAKVAFPVALRVVCNSSVCPIRVIVISLPAVPEMLRVPSNGISATSVS